MTIAEIHAVADAIDSRYRAFVYLGAFCGLRLGELDYLFLDGSFFKMHDGAAAEPVLVAYGITAVGKPVLLAVEPAVSGIRPL